MRVVLDTNVVSSALLWGGTRERLIALAGEGSLELFTSEALRDPDDAHVLACALAARAEAIVSGDADLHALGSYQGIPVLSARRLPQAHYHLNAQRPARLLAARRLPLSVVPIRSAFGGGYLGRPD